MQGVTEPLGYDLADAQFVLSFGAGLLESWLGPVHNSRAFARLRRSSERPRGLFVQVDPRAFANGKQSGPYGFPSCREPMGSWRLASPTQ